MIRELKSDVLRDKAKEIDVITYEIKILLNDMVETMIANRGVGLAAPQIGISLRAIVLNVEGITYKLINPIIVKQEGQKNSEEGCLSLPGQYGKVRRPEKIIVKALNELGEEVEITGRWLLAAALSHEIDHLDGVLFIDKLRKQY